MFVSIINLIINVLHLLPALIGGLFGYFSNKKAEKILEQRERYKENKNEKYT